MLLPLVFVCPHCAQAVESAADPSQGAAQTYVEDCQVCCSPLRLEVRCEGGHASAEAYPEGA